MSIGLTMKGRLGRKRYFMWSVIIVLVAAAIVFVLARAAGETGKGVGLMTLFAALIALFACASQGFLAVRRLHDIGKPGSHYWLFLVPFYNIYLGLILLFTQSVKGANQYGPEPTAA